MKPHEQRIQYPFSQDLTSEFASLEILTKSGGPNSDQYVILHWIESLVMVLGCKNPLLRLSFPAGNYRDFIIRGS